MYRLGLKLLKLNVKSQLLVRKRNKRQTQLKGFEGLQVFLHFGNYTQSQPVLKVALFVIEE